MPSSVTPALLLSLALAVALAAPAAASFVDIAAGLTPVTFSAGAWGDYDNDGDLDILLTGSDAGVATARLYRNDGGAFAAVATALPGVISGAVAWGDYDNDGDLDVLLTGLSAGGSIARVYRNDGGGMFSDIGAGLPGVVTSAAAWADYDNDGHLDFVLSGSSAAGRIARLYHNNGGGSFTDAGAGLRGVASSALAWADYDNDGDQDLLLTGEDSISTHISRLYRNDGGGLFTDIGAALEAVNNCAVAWGDEDADGDLDLVLGGHMMDGSLVFHLYRNDGVSGFSEMPVPVPGLLNGSAAWGDADNDGDLDLLVSGATQTVNITRLYLNGGNSQLVDSGVSLPGVALGVGAWGDYDNDGHLDILLAGGQNGGASLARVYRNTAAAPPNAPPAPPTHLRLSVAPGRLVFSWDAPLDDHTPTAALSYNLRVGTSSVSANVVSPHADPTTGFRRVVGLGNSGQRLAWSVPLSSLPSGPFVWGVQAVDAAWRGSAFAVGGPVSAVGEPVEPSEPAGLTLSPAEPNPFRRMTTIRFALAAASRITLDVFDARGRRVIRLADGERRAGKHEVEWRAEDERLGAGVYWVRLEGSGVVRVERVLLVR